MALTTSLISVWELKEASGNALDSFGSNTLTETSGTIDASGSKPSALAGSRDFELGDTECFRLTDNADVSFGDEDMSVAAWVNAESLPSSGNLAYIVAKDELGGGSREYILFLQNSGGTIRFIWGVWDSGGTLNTVEASTFGTPSTATWYHIAAWHDSVNNQLGIAVNTTSNTSSYSGGMRDQTASFNIGGSSAATPDRNWDGLICQVALWNKVLSSQDRTDLYAAGAGLPYSSWGGGVATAVPVFMNQYRQRWS